MVFIVFQKNSMSIKNEIKQDWQKLKLNDLGTVDRGRSRHRPRNDPSLYGGKYPFIQTGDVKSANFYITNYSQTYNEKGLAQSKLWEPNTLCITIAANISESAILKIPACFPDSIVGFYSYKDKSDVRFVKYLLDVLKKEFQQISHGAAQDNLSLEKILSINFNVPQYPEQKKIAEVLSVYDDLIEINQKKIELLEEMVQSIYKEWFIKPAENGIPDGWRVEKVENLLKRISPGKKYENKTASASGSIPILDQGKTGIIGFHDEVPGIIASEEHPIIVFANHTCYQNLVMFSFSTIQNVLPFYPGDDIHRNIYWLHYATKDLVSFNDYKGHWPEFISKKIQVPPVDLCDEFGEMIKSMLVEKFKLQKQNQNLKKTRDLLIPQLIGGKISLK